MHLCRSQLALLHIFQGLGYHAAILFALHVIILQGGLPFDLFHLSGRRLLVWTLGSAWHLPRLYQLNTQPMQPNLTLPQILLLYHLLLTLEVDTLIQLFYIRAFLIKVFLDL